MTIKHFIINKKEKNLSLIRGQVETKVDVSLLSFEYLRISTPEDNNGQIKAIISHKKQVQLLAIESVAKHGYRFLFDDQHSAIYSDYYLQTLIAEQTDRWQAYLDKLKSSGHSRDTIINIQQV